jgi:hypothetical protein
MRSAGGFRCQRVDSISCRPRSIRWFGLRGDNQHRRTLGIRDAADPARDVQIPMIRTRTRKCESQRRFQTTSGEPETGRSVAAGHCASKGSNTAGMRTEALAGEEPTHVALTATGLLVRLIALPHGNRGQIPIMAPLRTFSRDTARSAFGQIPPSPGLEEDLEMNHIFYVSHLIRVLSFTGEPKIMNVITAMTTPQLSLWNLRHTQTSPCHTDLRDITNAVVRVVRPIHSLVNWNPNWSAVGRESRRT